MDARELAKYMKWCLERDIKIYPKSNNSGKYYIIISKNGKESMSEHYYENQGGYRLLIENNEKVKKYFPSVHTRIAELYKQTFDMNINKSAA